MLKYEQNDREFSFKDPHSLENNNCLVLSN